MPNYVIELYGSSSDVPSVRSAADRLAAGARRLSDEGTRVRYLDTIFLPGDETCFHLLEAGSEEDVRAVARNAGIDADRIVPARQIDPLPDPRDVERDASRSSPQEEGLP
jgi:Protein of unknown function (DUF4242)